MCWGHNDHGQLGDGTTTDRLTPTAVPAIADAVEIDNADPIPKTVNTDIRQVRNYPEQPPVIPHKVFMRENCQACHAGPAARKEIRTEHPERAQCRQCHVEQVVTSTFSL